VLATAPNFTVQKGKTKAPKRVASGFDNMFVLKEIISLIIPNSAVTAFEAIFVSYLLATH